MATEKKEPEVVLVTMTDGRKVEFTGKRKLLKETVISADGAVRVRLDWRNGETRLFTIPPALLGKFAGHGAEQKLGDEIAGLKDDKGQDADIDDCVLVVDELIDRLYNGEWSTKREANGLAGTSVLIQALVRMYNGAKTVEQVKEFLKGKTQAEKVALRGNPRVKPIVEAIEAEKAEKSAKKVDTEALLAGLEA
jgi:hypothetical protein